MKHLRATERSTGCGNSLKSLQEHTAFSRGYRRLYNRALSAWFCFGVFYVTVFRTYLSVVLDNSEDLFKNSGGYLNPLEV